MVDGWFFIFFAVILVSASVLPQTGRIRRNYLIGIRLGPLMRSERAWRNGHREAAKVFVPTAAIVTGYGVCMITEWPSWMTAINLDLLRAVGVGIVVAGALWGSYRGLVGATRAPDPGSTGQAA